MKESIAAICGLISMFILFWLFIINDSEAMDGIKAQMDGSWWWKDRIAVVEQMDLSNDEKVFKIKWIKRYAEGE